MNFNINVIAATIILATVSHAHASNDVYIGAGAGFTHFHGLNKIDGVKDGTEDAAAASAFIGYNINEYLGAELGYNYSGRGNTDGNRFENQGGTLSVIGRVPVYGDLSVFGEAGGYWAHTDGLETKDTKVSSLFGAGLTYRINDHLDIQSRWRYMRNVADLNDPSTELRLKPNQNTTTLEVVYHPFRGISAPVTPPPVIDYPAVEEPVAQDKTFELASDVLFTFGKATLKTEGKVALDELYQKLLSENPKDGNALIVGYTDRIGAANVNQKLSEQRAQSVADYLIYKGLPASKVTIEGRGSADSITGSRCEDSSSKNELINCLAPDRRVEVKLVAVKTVTK
ncbi:OmpA family protein [Aeromonas veronii]|uniref:OmpA family protein n=1 Tax=Aeromonas veronii TaxID=654 RepID=UPI0005C18F3A|nr:OmpA family protein [Aeromonas veronii]ELI6424617.1 OmpA family protein [Aeromonas veronii]